MNRSFRVVIAALSGLVMQATAHSSNYIDTSGNVLTQEQVGTRCRPTERLSDGRLMIYSTSQEDIRMLRERMLLSGERDEAVLAKWAQMAADNSDCTNRDGVNCASGKCATGTCREEKKGDYYACACK